MAVFRTLRVYGTSIFTTRKPTSSCKLCCGRDFSVFQDKYTTPKMAKRMSIIDTFNDAMDNISDPRVKDWFMMRSIFPTLFIVFVYVHFVKMLGPKLMSKRKPFALDKIMLVYNIVQIFISAYLFKEVLAAGWLGKYSLRCQLVDYSNSPDGLRMAWTCYLYYLSKFSELSDTIFFVLRKKDRQISMLHVVHHGIMPISTWVGVKLGPGGHGSAFVALNTFVHIWMYLYYFLAALGPTIQPYLWWKKYLTSMQMVQFVLILIHSLQLFFIECDYPKSYVWIILFHAALFLFMFKDFYDKAYKPKNGKESELNVDGLKVDPHSILVNELHGSEVKQD